MAISVLINGAFGKMGRMSSNALHGHADFEVVAELGRGDHLAEQIEKHQPQVVLDLTLPDCVYDNAQVILTAGSSPVIGTSGLTVEQIEVLQAEARARQIGGLIVPNFSIGAILMMQFAQEAAKFMSNVEIIELHHEQKVDAPSGTAKKTAELIASVRAESVMDYSDQEVPIASVRLPGLFAHQAVVFQGMGETLTIKHDAHSRQSMRAGVLLACRRVLDLNELVYGHGPLLS